MADELSIDPETVRTGGTGIGAQAMTLRQHWAAFNAQVAAMGDIFGDDSVGGLIGSSYQAAHGVAERSVGSVADAFDEFASGLHLTADRYTAIEHEITQRFQGLWD